jgi:hypothetical protein
MPVTPQQFWRVIETALDLEGLTDAVRRDIEPIMEKHIVRPATAAILALRAAADAADDEDLGEDDRQLLRRWADELTQLRDDCRGSDNILVLTARLMEFKGEFVRMAMKTTLGVGDAEGDGD